MIHNNQKGFAMAISLAILPLFISALLIGFAAVGFVETDLNLKYQCRTQGLQGQSKVAPLLTSLLALNLRARALRIEQWIARAEAFEATLALNFPLAARALKREREIQRKRENLDKKQKQIIKKSNQFLRQAHETGAQKIRASALTQDNKFFNIQLTSLKGKAPELAVRPKDSDVAPVYETVSNFETEQSLAHEWQYKISIRAPFSHFIPGQFTFNKACAVSLKKKDLLWLPSIVKGKFSLKSAW